MKIWEEGLDQEQNKNISSSEKKSIYVIYMKYDTICTISSYVC